MTKKLSALFVLLVTIVLTAEPANAKGDDQHVYLPMPDGRYYEIPKSKKILGKDVVTCIAYAEFPEAYFNAKPFACEGYNAAIALAQIAQNFKAPAKVIALPSGIVFSNNSGLIGEDLLCKIKASYPADFSTYSTYFNTQNISCNPLRIDVNSAFSDATSSIALRLGIAITLFLLMTIGLIGKPRDTLLKQCRWFGSIGGVIAIAVVSQGNRNFDDYLFILSINLFAYITIGTLFGVICFKVKEPPKISASVLSDTEPNGTADNVMATIHKPEFLTNIFLESALRELDTDARNELLWAKCVVVSDGDLMKAKAEYLRLRVAQMTEEKET